MYRGTIRDPRVYLGKLKDFYPGRGPPFSKDGLGSSLSPNAF